MEFIGGFITGLLTTIFMFVVIVFLKVGLITFVDKATTKISSKGPKPTGAIFIPKDEATLAREEIIKKNRREGKDTPLSDLL